MEGVHWMAKNLKRVGRWEGDEFTMEGDIACKARLSFIGGMIHLVVYDPHRVSEPGIGYMTVKEAKSLYAALRHAIKQTEKENVAGTGEGSW